MNLPVCLLCSVWYVSVIEDVDEVLYEYESWLCGVHSAK